MKRQDITIPAAYDEHPDITNPCGFVGILLVITSPAGYKNPLNMV